MYMQDLNSVRVYLPALISTLFYTICIGVPDAPSSIHVRGINKDSLTLEWSPPEYDGGTKVRQYIIEMSVGDSSTWEKLGTVDQFRTQFLVSKLKPETDYLFAVSAENDVGISQQQATSKPVRLEKPISKWDFFLFSCSSVVCLFIFVLVDGKEYNF